MVIIGKGNIFKNNLKQVIFKTNGRIFNRYWLKMNTLFYILMLCFHHTFSKQINQGEILRKYEHPFQIERGKLNTSSSLFTNQVQLNYNANFLRDNLENDIDNLVTRSVPLRKNKKNYFKIYNDKTLNKSFRKTSDNFSTKSIPAAFNRTLAKKEKVGEKFIKEQHLLKSKVIVPAVTNQSKKASEDQRATSIFQNDLFSTHMVAQKNIKNKPRTISKFTGNEDDNIDDSDYVLKAKAILNQYKDIDISDEEAGEEAPKDNEDIQNSSKNKSSLKGEKTYTKSSSDEVFEKSPIKPDENNSPITEKVEAVETNSKIKPAAVANDNMTVENMDKAENNEGYNLANKNETQSNDSSLFQTHFTEKDMLDNQNKSEKLEPLENNGVKPQEKPDILKINGEETQENQDTNMRNRGEKLENLDTLGKNSYDAQEKMNLQSNSNQTNNLIEQVNGSVLIENSNQSETTQNVSQINKATNEAKNKSLQNDISLQKETNLSINDISNLRGIPNEDQKTSLPININNNFGENINEEKTTNPLSSEDNTNSVEKLDEKHESNLVTQSNKLLSNIDNEKLVSSSDNEKLIIDRDNKKLINYTDHENYEKDQFIGLSGQRRKDQELYQLDSSENYSVKKKPRNNTLEFQKVEPLEGNKTADIATLTVTNVESVANTVPNANGATNTVPKNATVKRGAALTFSKVYIQEKKPLLNEESIQKIIKEEEESDKYDRLADQRETLKIDINNSSNLPLKKVDHYKAKLKPGIPLFNKNKYATQEDDAFLASPISDPSAQRETSKTNMQIKNNFDFQKIDHLKQPLFPASNAKTDSPEDSAEKAYASLDGAISEPYFNKENNSKNIKEEEIYASIDNSLTRNKTSEELERAKSNLLSEETEEWRKHIYKEVDDPKLKHKNKKKIIAWVPAKIVKDNMASKKERLFRKRNMLKLTPIEKKMAEILVIEGHNIKKFHGKNLKYNDIMRSHTKRNHTIENKKNFNNVFSNVNLNKTITDKEHFKNGVNIKEEKGTSNVASASGKFQVNYMKFGKQPIIDDDHIKKSISSIVSSLNQFKVYKNESKIQPNNRTVQTKTSRNKNANRTKTDFVNSANQIKTDVNNFNQSNVFETDVYENQKCSLDDYLCHSIDTSLKREEILKQRKVINEGELKNVERSIEQTIDSTTESSKNKLNDTVNIKVAKAEPEWYNQSKNKNKLQELNEVRDINKKIVNNNRENNIIAEEKENLASKLDGNYNQGVEASIATTKYRAYTEDGYNNQTIVNQTTANENQIYANESPSNITIKKTEHDNFVKNIQPINLFKENKKVQNILLNNDIAISNKKPKVENIVHVYIEKRPIKKFSKHLSATNEKTLIHFNKTLTNHKKSKKHSLASKLTEDEIEKLIVAANALKSIDINSLVNGVKQKHHKKLFENKHYKRLRHKQLLQNSKDLTPENLVVTGEKEAATKNIEIKFGSAEPHLMNVTVTSDRPFFNANESMFIDQAEKPIIDKKIPFLNTTKVKPSNTGQTLYDSYTINRETQLLNETKEQPVDIDKKKAKADVKKMVEEQLLLAEKFKAVAEEQVEGKANESMLMQEDRGEVVTEHQGKGEQEKSAALQNEALAEQNIRVAELQIEKLQNDEKLNEFKNQQKHEDTPILETTYLNTNNDKEKKIASNVVSPIQTETTELLKKPISKFNPHENFVVLDSKLNVPIQDVLKNIDKKAPIIKIKEDKKTPPKSLIDPEGITNVYTILQSNITSVLSDTDKPLQKQSPEAEKSLKQPSSETESLSKLIRLMNLEEFSFNQNKDNTTSQNFSSENEKSKLLTDFKSPVFVPQNNTSLVTKNISNDSNFTSLSQFTNVEQNNIFSNTMLEKELLALVPSTNAIYHPRKNPTEVFVSSVEDAQDSGASINGVTTMGKTTSEGGSAITMGGASATSGATNPGSTATESNGKTVSKVNQATSMINESFTQWIKFPNATVNSGKLFQTKNDSSNLIPSILENALKSSPGENRNIEDENSNLEKTESIDFINPPINIALPDHVAKSKSRETKPFHRGAMLLLPAVGNVANSILEQKPNEITKNQQSSEEQNSVKELTKDVSGAMEELETLMKKKTEEVNKIVRQNEHNPLKVGHSHQVSQ
ncbi:uncharacterized protein PF3D7_1120600 isoform X2 [Hydra vulgaris]